MFITTLGNDAAEALANIEHCEWEWDPCSGIYQETIYSRTGEIKKICGTYSVEELVAFSDEGDRSKLSLAYNELISNKCSFAKVDYRLANKQLKDFVISTKVWKLPYPHQHDDGCQHNGFKLKAFSSVTNSSDHISSQDLQHYKTVNSLFDTFMEQLNFPTWVTCEDGNILYANTHFSNLLNRKLDKTIGRSVFELFGPEMGQVYKDNNDHVLRTAENLRSEEKAPRPDGSIGDFLVIKFPMNFGHLKVPAVGGIAIDISDLKQRESRLSELNQQAAESLRARDLFLAKMSHELRTPLHVILVNCDLLLSGSLDKESHDLVLTLKECGFGLLSLVNYILDTTSLESGKIKINRTAKKLDEMGDFFKKVYKQRCSDKGLEFEFNCDVEGACLFDDRYVKQVLDNILGIAIKLNILKKEK